MVFESTLAPDVHPRPRPRLPGCLPAFLAGVLSLSALGARALPSFEEVRQAYRPSDTRVQDRHGEEIQRIRTDATVRRGQWLALTEVSPALRTALVLSEDKRFYEHSGVDWQAVSAAAWGNLWHQRTRGASTLTMQLAGLLDEDWRSGSGGRSIGQKLGQTVAAQVLDRRWRKDQILEAYLNLVPFRGELVGVDALSRTLFDKAAHGLDQREAAVAAALLRAPNAKAQQVAQRACGIEKAMAVQAKASSPVDCEALDLFATGALQRRAFDASSGIAPHFSRRLLKLQRQSAPPQAALRSTLDAGLQRFAVQTLQQHLRELRTRHVEDGAVLVLDNRTGDVLAWVGTSGELSQAAEVDAVLALRQPGSTLKPFLYAQALAEKRLTVASLLEDAPTHIPTASGLYIPQNYDHQFKGWVSVRTALAASLNVPAVRTLVMVGPERFQAQLNRFGLAIKESGDFYGYSLALGSAEVSLLNLTNAYRALANSGVWSATRALADAPVAGKSDAVIAPGAAFIVSDVLADTNARARTFGTDSVLATRRWSAVKTGTSKDMRDNWTLGYSRRYTVGVWVGNASGAAMHDVSGTSGAAPVWAAVMGYLHRGLPPSAKDEPTPPIPLIRQQVRFGDDLEAPRQEWFLPGTVQALFATDSIADNAYVPSRNSLNNVKILSPTQGSVLALDPDIPPQRQRVTLQASAVSPSQAAQLRWLLDGKPLAKGATAQWLPWPGRHVLSLVAPDGSKLDEVRVEVRGAGVREGARTGERTKPLAQ